MKLYGPDKSYACSSSPSSNVAYGRRTEILILGLQKTFDQLDMLEDPDPDTFNEAPKKSRIAASEKIMHGTTEETLASRIWITSVCPEMALLYAVIEDAFFCFRGQKERQAQRAEEWFFSDDSNSLFSFLCICDALDVQPEYIRKKLKRRDPAS